MNHCVRLIGLSLFAVCLSALCSAQFHRPNTPVQHVIVVVQENRTPDNLFLADQNLIRNGAHLAGSGMCKTTRIQLTPWQLDACFDPSHFHKGGWLPTYDGGKMDGACTIPAGLHTGCGVPPCPNPNYAYCPEYTYVPNTKFDGVHGILDPYFQLAEQYGFANYMFQTNQGPSFPAHLFLISGTSAPTQYPEPYYQWFAAENLPGSQTSYGCIAPSGTTIKDVAPAGSESYVYAPPVPSGAAAGYPCYEHRTLTDLLDQSGISWRYYANFESSLWNAPNAIAHMCQSSGFGGHCEGPAFRNGQVVTHAARILTDLGVNGSGRQSCQLQQVSWVIPDGNWSDHPGNVGADGGPSWVAAIVNAVGGYDNYGNLLPVQCNYWQNTVILITWDDWGGFYDDVNPIQVMGQGQPGYLGSGGNGASYVYGFRVPLLVVSSFARQGFIDGPASNPTCPNDYCHDFGSILNFIEYAFGTNGRSLGTVGPQAWPFADAFVQDASGFFYGGYSLHQFFNFGQTHAFTPVMGAKYSTACFLNPSSCFVNGPLPADSD